MRIYVTKYALTKGIFTIEAELLEGGKYAREAASGRLGYFLGKRDYALRLEDALLQAEKKREARMKSLGEQVRELMALKGNFRVKESEV